MKMTLINPEYFQIFYSSYMCIKKYSSLYSEMAKNGFRLNLGSKCNLKFKCQNMYVNITFTVYQDLDQI